MIERIRNYGVVAVFGLLFVVLALASSSFLSWRNAANILEQSSVLLIMAATTTVCIIAGIFDLSIAAVATAAAIAAAHAINSFGLVPGIFVGIGFGGLLGLITGFGNTRTNVNSFIGTLAASFTYRGLGLIISSGALVAVSDFKSAADLQSFMEGTLFGLKGAVWIAIAFTVVVGALLSFTVFGRQVYAVGGSVQAARLAGIRTDRVLIACYTLSGIGAGITGIIYVGRYGSAATNTYADTFAFTAIAATVVGGVSIFGGAGAIWRGSMGIFTFALIGNGLNLLGVDTTYQLTILGLLIFATVAADQVFRRTSS